MFSKGLQRDCTGICRHSPIIGRRAPKQTASCGKRPKPRTLNPKPIEGVGGVRPCPMKHGDLPMRTYELESKLLKGLL